ncbi:MAG: hypothetical protein R2762_17025 [Bryobacteraceae bacterium]
MRITYTASIDGCVPLSFQEAFEISPAGAAKPLLPGASTGLTGAGVPFDGSFYVQGNTQTLPGSTIIVFRGCVNAAAAGPARLWLAQCRSGRAPSKRIAVTASANGAEIRRFQGTGRPLPAKGTDVAMEELVLAVEGWSVR